MAFQPNNYSGRTFVADTATYDTGLRRYMIAVYNHMMLGLLVTGLVSWGTANNPTLFHAVSATPLAYAVMFAPFAFILVLQMNIARLSLGAAQAVFYAFSAVMGLSLSYIFFLYTHQSLEKVFFITAATFGGMSLYGYTTKRNLTGMGSFLIMGLWGIILSGLANMFLFHSAGMDFALSVVSVIIFTGLTAWKTQAIRNNYNEGYGVQSNGKLAILGSLSLYLSFINLFVSILRLTGNRR